MRVTHFRAHFRARSACETLQAKAQEVAGFDPQLATERERRGQGDGGGDCFTSCGRNERVWCQQIWPKRQSTYIIHARCVHEFGDTQDETGSLGLAQPRAEAARVRREQGRAARERLRPVSRPSPATVTVGQALARRVPAWRAARVSLQELDDARGAGMPGRGSRFASRRSGVGARSGRPARGGQEAPRVCPTRERDSGLAPEGARQP